MRPSKNGPMTRTEAIIAICVLVLWLIAVVAMAMPVGR